MIGDFLGAQEDLDPFGAEALTAAGFEDDLAVQALFGHGLFKGLGHFLASQGQTARAAAHQDGGLIGIPAGLEFPAIFG